MWGGSTNSTRPRHCRSIIVFFSSPKRPPVDPALGLDRLREETLRLTRFRPLDTSANCVGREVGQPREVLRPATAHRGKLSPLVAVGQRKSNVATCGLSTSRSFSSVEPVGHQAEGHVDPLDVRVLRPAEQPDQPVGLAPGQHAQVARGDEVLGVLEQAWRCSSARPRPSIEDPLDEPVQQR